MTAAETKIHTKIKPDQKPIMHQKWRDLIFLHWEWEPQEIQKTLPPGLTVDLFDGKAYIGIVAFFMPQVRLLRFPWIGFSNLMEINLRTYVYDENGQPGIWFYSLDVNRFLVAYFAERLFHLPYFYARMNSSKRAASEVDFFFSRQPSSIWMEFDYRPQGKIFQAKEDTLDYFLIERYVLFAYDTDHVYSKQVFHQPYPLQEASLIKWNDDLFELNHLKKPQRQPEHLLFSQGVDVDVY